MYGAPVRLTIYATTSINKGRRADALLVETEPAPVTLSSCLHGGSAKLNTASSLPTPACRRKSIKFPDRTLVEVGPRVAPYAEKKSRPPGRNASSSSYVDVSKKVGLLVASSLLIVSFSTLEVLLIVVSAELVPSTTVVPC